MFLNVEPYQYNLNKTEYKVQIKMQQGKIYRLSLFLHFLTLIKMYNYCMANYD